MCLETSTVCEQRKMVGSESETKRKLQQPLSCITNYFGDNKPKLSDKDLEEKNGNFVSNSDTNTKSSKHGGWKAIIFILGNETFERLASFGLLANFMVYLLRVFHMDQVSASNIINIWSGLTNFGPLLGAYISDTYVGRFKTIAYASFASLLGMATITLTTWIPQLHPPPCTANQNDQQLLTIDHHNCKGPNTTQLGFLLLGLCIISVGSAGIRPCSIPFGVDQFDHTTDEGRKGINSFFNWYYTSFTVVLLITSTVVVYIQDSVSWVLGFAIPTFLMFCSIVLFFIGMNMYNHVKPEGSIFLSIAQVFVAAYKKRKLKLPVHHGDHVVEYYDPPLKKTTVVSKLPHTNEYRFFDKAAIITDNDVLNADGCPTNKWRLCSIQEVEEVKCLIRITPVWASGIISLTSITQSGTFLVSQALNMDRHLGPKFQIPAGSVNVISMITIGLWLPFYDRFLVPSLRRITKHESGITLLQRIGIGIVFSIISMVVAGFIEKERRASATLHMTQPHHQKPMSVFWLAPQLILLGLCEAFNIIGQIEFFNKQFPEHMRSIANSLFSVSFAGASYFSSILITVVHHASGTRDRPDWLTSDINVGRVDYYYFLIAGIGVINLLYFLYISHRYHYKGSSVQEDDYKPHVDELELNTIRT